MAVKPKAHKLSKNKVVEYPQYFCFVDTETTQVKEDERILQKLRLGVSKLVRFRYDTKGPTIRRILFNDPHTFWRETLNYISGKNTLHIICHNAVFDMTVLQHIEYLTAYGYECQFVFDDNMTFISKWRNRDKRVMILDNANWFKGKLSKWGDVLGLEKLSMPDLEDDEETWFVYCERDVDILIELQKWLIKFITEENLGKWKYTIASQSFTAYRHRFMTHPIYIPEPSRETELARKAYRGGRTECFKIGEYKNGPFWKLDICSMYPYCMAYHKYPCAVEGIALNPPISSIANIRGKVSAIGKFDVCVDLPYFPHSHNDHSIYPVGEFTTYLTTPEILLGLEHGWLKKCHELVTYRQRPIFRKYVEYFYPKKVSAKQEGKTLLEKTYKLFLVSLYGKFGQLGYEDKIIGSAPLYSFPTSFGYDAAEDARYTLRQVGHNVIRSEKSGEAYNSFCAIAAHVTAFARIYLYELILLAGQDNVYYCDTDSIIVNANGYRELYPYLDDYALGKLKVEGVSDTIEIVAPKHYKFDEQWTMKGIRKDAVQLEENKYRQEVWPGFNKILSWGGNSYYNYFIEKKVSCNIYSGTVLPDGRVEPFKLKEI